MVRKEKDQIEQSLAALTRTPFFKPIADQSSFKRITELENQISQKDRGIMEAKEVILKGQESLKEIAFDYRQINGEKDNYTSEISRLQTQLDPNTMSMGDI